MRDAATGVPGRPPEVETHVTQSSSERKNAYFLELVMPTQMREVGVRETSAVGNWEAGDSSPQTAAAFTSSSSVDLALEAEELNFLTRPRRIFFLPLPSRGRLSTQFSRPTGLQSCGIYIPHPAIPARCKRDRVAVFRSYCPPVRSPAPAQDMDLFPLRLSPHCSLSLF